MWFELFWFLWGVLFTLFVQWGWAFIQRARRLYNYPPQPPRTAAQKANKAVYEDIKAHHPVVGSMRIQRRPRRQPGFKYVEENPFEQT